MPKTFFYDDVKIIKKPFINRLKGFGIFFLCVITIAGVVVSSIFLSRALSVGNITTALVYGGTDIKINKHSYFLVTLGSYDDYNEAEKVALGSTIQGASGYIWTYNDKYYVVGNAYKSQDDAESVKKNLSSSKYDVEILEVTFPKLNMSFDLENKDVQKLREAVDFIDVTYDTLYNYSIKFDKGEINNFAISSGISSLRGDCKVQISSVQNLISSKPETLQKLINCLTKIDEILNSAILKTIDNSATNYSLKNAIVSVIFEKYSFYNAI